MKTLLCRAAIAGWVVSIALFCCGCGTTKFISREKAIQIAKDKTIADNFQIDDYKLRSVKESKFKNGKTRWLVVFDGTRPALGNYFGVFGDKETGEAMLVNGL